MSTRSVLVPTSSDSFADPQYWDTFFRRRGRHSFEWYGDYMELCGVLHKYIKSNDKLLVVGCGNSELSVRLYDFGVKNISNIDVSEVVIKHMQQKYTKTRPGLTFHIMNALDISFADESFSVVLDKGTLDTVYCEDTKESRDRALSLLDEVSRVLKTFGRYVCFSMLQDYILKDLLDYFEKGPWLVRIIRCVDVEKKLKECSLPIFSVICTKLKTPSSGTMFELSLSEDEMFRPRKEDIIRIIKSMQNAELICNGVSRRNLTMAEYKNGEVSVEVSRSGIEGSRYKIIVKDRADECDIMKMTYCAFFVPFGRNNDWIFSTLEGREVLQSNCDRDRVTIIMMNSRQKYPTKKEELQKEVEDVVIKLAPLGVVDRKEKVQFMTLGEDSDKRTTVYEGSSEISGNFFVEDVEEKKGIFRRLYFKNRPRLIQSEIKIIKAVPQKQYPGVTRNLYGNMDDDEEEEAQKEMDTTYISNDYHLLVGVAVGVHTVINPRANILLLGLGGGVLTGMIHRFFPYISMEAVEIDGKMLEVAKKCFFLKHWSNLKVYVQDGLTYMKDVSEIGMRYDIIIVDVDSKDETSAICCPPSAFLQDEFLSSAASSLSRRGVVIMNFVCRSANERAGVVKKIGKHFEKALALRTKEDVNEVMVMWQNKADIFVANFERAADEFKQLLVENGITFDEELLDVTRKLSYAVK